MTSLRGEKIRSSHSILTGCFSHQVGSEGQVEDQSGTEHCRKLVSFTLSGERTHVVLWCGEILTGYRLIDSLTLLSKRRPLWKYQTLHSIVLPVGAAKVGCKKATNDWLSTLPKLRTVTVAKCRHIGIQTWAVDSRWCCCP